MTKQNAAVSGTPAKGLFGATLGFFTGFASVALFGTTAAKFREIMHLTPFLVGLLVAMPSLSGSILRVPFAAWVDTTGGRKPFLILLSASIVGMLGLFLLIYFLYPSHLTVNLYPLLLLLGLLSGCGIATFSVGISQVSYWFPQKKQGQALATFGGVGNLAPGIFSFLLPIALKNWGLAGSYLAWLLFLMLETLLYFKTGLNAWYFQMVHSGVSAEQARELARQKGQEIFPTGSSFKSLQISAGTWKTWALSFIYFTTFGGFIALTAWFPTYWKDYFGATILFAGTMTGAYSILTSLVRVAGGNISDGLGGEKTAILALGVMFVGALALMSAQSIFFAVTGQILLAMGMGVCNAAVFKLVPQEVPQAVGGASGWVGGLGAFGGFLIPLAMGVFASQGRVGYSLGFSVFAILAAVSVVLAFALKMTRAKK